MLNFTGFAACDSMRSRQQRRRILDEPPINNAQPPLAGFNPSAPAGPESSFMRASSIDHPGVEHHAPTENNSVAWAIQLKRNCSISPRALGWAFAVTALVSFAIGLGFAVFGLWVVLPFAGLEMIALGLAFYVNGRHAGDFERIALVGEMLELDIRDGPRVERHRFNPRWVRLLVREARRDLRLAFAASGREIPIGRHLDAAGRARLARELEVRIARASVREALKNPVFQSLLRTIISLE